MIDETNAGKLRDACAKRSPGCALSRLRDELRVDFKTLVDVGARIGLTVSECGGIMDGWDSIGPDGTVSAHDAPLFRPDHDGQVIRPLDESQPMIVAEYEAGAVLGRKLAAEFRWNDGVGDL